MFLALMLFNFLHPGRVLTGPESEFPKKIKMTKVGKKEAKAEKKRAKEQKKMQGIAYSDPSAYEPVPYVEMEYSRPETEYSRPEIEYLRPASRGREMA
jgi:hypothetical protein